MQTPETILCIPGNWVDRSDFIRRVITQKPEGRFMFAGGILLDSKEDEHVKLEFFPRAPEMLSAFEMAGQGLLGESALSAVRAHTSVAYLLVPPDLLGELARIVKFTELLRSIGGAAIKVETAGVAHSWDRWTELLAGHPFNIYTAAITLVADVDYFYSCGMHNFSLPDCEVPVTIGAEVASELMNQFNYWRLAEKPLLENGHTFSLESGSPRYRVQHIPDSRHDNDHPFFNPYGLWRLTRG